MSSSKNVEPLKHSVNNLALTVNGEQFHVSPASYKTLLEVLREDVGLTGTKHGCELGECGACAVIIDGEPVLSCLALPIECLGKEITTVEGLVQDGEIDPLQAAWAEKGGSQCGYCSPGMLVTAKALLLDNPSPSREEIRQALAGNLCRCTGYQMIYQSLEDAVRRIGEENEQNRKATA